jgi:hypothetical protein
MLLHELPPEIIIGFFDYLEIYQIRNLAIINKPIYKVFKTYQNSICKSQLSKLNLNCPEIFQPKVVLVNIHKLCLSILNEFNQVPSKYINMYSYETLKPKQIYKIFYSKVFWPFAFEHAADFDNILVMKLLIHNGMQISRSLFFHTLRIASFKNNYDTVHFLFNLLPKSFFCDDQSKHPINLLHYDLRQIIILQLFDVAKLLISYGATLNYGDFNYILNYPFDNSVKYKVLDLLDTPNIIKNNELSVNYISYDYEYNYDDILPITI